MKVDESKVTPAELRYYKHYIACKKAGILSKDYGDQNAGRRLCGLGCACQSLKQNPVSFCKARGGQQRDDLRGAPLTRCRVTDLNAGLNSRKSLRATLEKH